MMFYEDIFFVKEIQLKNCFSSSTFTRNKEKREENRIIKIHSTLRVRNIFLRIMFKY